VAHAGIPASKPLRAMLLGIVLNSNVPQRPGKEGGGPPSALKGAAGKKRVKRA